MILLAAILAVSVLVVVQNFQTVEIRLFRAAFEVRLGWALLIAGTIGGGLALVFSWLLRRH